MTARWTQGAAPSHPRTAPSHPRTFAPSHPHVVLYDGVCGLCNGLVQFLLRHDRRQAFRFAAIQSPAGRAMVERLTGSAALPSSMHVIAGYETDASRVFTQSDAVLFIARELGWPWRAAGVLRILPRGLRDWLYGALANSRYRWFGRYEQCVLPQPEHQERFL